MRIRAGVVIFVGLALWSVAAAADTYYQYRDKATGRDVFVNRLEQVPRKYRAQAKIVLETRNTPEEPPKAPAVEVVTEQPQPAAPPIHISLPSDNFKKDVRQALSGKDLLRDGPALASTMFDLKLAAAGKPPLTGAERNDFGSLIVTVFIAAIIAGVAALVAWVVIIVTAVRDQRLWWAFFIFIFSPLGYLYVFIHGGKDRAVFKTLCTLGMAAPALVGGVGAWRIYAWIQAVMRARGVQI